MYGNLEGFPFYQCMVWGGTIMTPGPWDTTNPFNFNNTMLDHSWGPIFSVTCPPLWTSKWSPRPNTRHLQQPTGFKRACFVGSLRPVPSMTWIPRARNMVVEGRKERLDGKWWEQIYIYIYNHMYILYVVYQYNMYIYNIRSHIYIYYVHYTTTGYNRLFWFGKKKHQNFRKESGTRVSTAGPSGSRTQGRASGCFLFLMTSGKMTAAVPSMLNLECCGFKCGGWVY